ncbi:MAG TPA: hypothetical protein VJ824_03465, partial [Bacillota bacterium]|nr:hypothetical protein [Bacillota bacterium]
GIISKGVNEMNKNLTKWLIGLSSVAVFTGFVGVVKNYDQKKTDPLPAKPLVDPSVLSDHNLTSQDQIKKEWSQTVVTPSSTQTENIEQKKHKKSHHDREEDHEEHEEHQKASGTINISTITTDQGTQNQPTKKVRSRAS